MFLRHFGWLALAAPLGAGAQTAPPTQGSSGERVYAAADFEVYSPQTALDVVRLIPGFVIQQADSRRGLSQDGANILINGEPVPGKGEATIGALSRIPYEDVVRVEVREGATLDVPGLAGQVVNIVVVVQSISGQFTWKPQFRVRRTNPVFLEGSASVSGSSGNFEYVIGFDNVSVRDGAAGPERVTNPDRLLIESREEVFYFDTDRPTFSGNVRYEGSETSSGQLNVIYRRFYADFNETSARTGPAILEQVRKLEQRQRDEFFEIGGNLEISAVGGLLKLTGLHRREESSILASVQTAFLDQSSSVGTQFDRDTAEKQSVLQAEQTWGGGSRSWQATVEFNSTALDVASTFFVLDTAGNFVQVPLVGASGRIEEVRAEARLAHNRPLSSNATIALSAGLEASRLRQANSSAPAGSFFRPTMSAAVNWQPNQELRLTAEVQRRIGQIEFLDFLASLDLVEEQINLSNPALKPPESWDFEMSARRSLGGFGEATLRGYARFIDNLVDRVPIGSEGAAVGNISKAHLYGVEWSSAFDLSQVGWRGGRLDARLQFQESKLGDPVTGGGRRISNNLRHLVELSLRHDVPHSDWVWGGGVAYVRRAPDFRINEIDTFSEGAVANLFIENKDVGGLRIRATVQQAVSYFQTLERLIFLDRRDGSLLAIEQRERSKGPIFNFAVSGKF